MKKRTITISLIVLAFVLLIGIGYAGWVISSQTEATADGGNFTAYSVDSSTLQVSAVSGNIVFGYKAPASAFTDPWLTYTDVTAESLSATFTVTWTNQVSGTKFTLTPQAYYANATSTEIPLNSKLIKAPTFSATGDAVVGEDGKLQLNAADGTATVTVLYGWGTCLSDATYDNPYLFFNSNTKTETADVYYADSNGETYEELASAALAALNTLIASDTSNPLKFRVVIAKA